MKQILIVEDDDLLNKNKFSHNYLILLSSSCVIYF